MPRWAAPPAIVAESLAGVADPLLTALHPGPDVSAFTVAGSLARSMAPPEESDPAPDWLLPEQVSSFRRVLAALRRYRGAMLADPVGSGKTYVALAVAETLNRSRTTTCLVPAGLLAQWERVAASIDVRVRLSSHEQVSRGRLPRGRSGLVIIDESHHFRNHQTRRYQHLAPWLIGRPVLLVSATPVVNRLIDLANQLLLAVRDDVLVMEGIASLKALLGANQSTAALGRLVMESECSGDRRPARALSSVTPGAHECSAAHELVQQLSRLRLSRLESVATLLRSVLLRAAASSPAALVAALRRYQSLLLHARDAMEAGRPFDRAELRRFTGESEDQLVLWQLLPETGTETELDLTDLPKIPELIRSVSADWPTKDAKLARLRELLEDGPPTLVFSTSRSTVRYIREQLGDLRLAWCTGERAGIGSGVLPRPAVLGWFRQPTQVTQAPRHLIVTDVAAEGLDLQRAGRVVHYDLPWTPMRLDQREGRSLRYGSTHRLVEVVRFLPPPALDSALGLQAALTKKAQLPGLAGIGPDGQRMWRWRTALAERFGHAAARAGVAYLEEPPAGLLAGFALHAAGQSSALVSTVLWLNPDGTWTETPDVIADRLAAAARPPCNPSVASNQLRDWLELLAVPIRERLALAQSRRWLTPEPSSEVRCLVRRLQGLVRDAARRHQTDRLRRLERALGFATGGHTAGEAMLVERLTRLANRELEAAVRVLPAPRQPWEVLEVRLTGLVLFGADSRSATRAATQAHGSALPSAPCQPPCKQFSSISTGL